ncbi:MAG: hypothetical protein ACK47R_08385, partial [Planctomycetia bacterium]
MKMHQKIPSKVIHPIDLKNGHPSRWVWLSMASVEANGRYIRYNSQGRDFWLYSVKPDGITRQRYTVLVGKHTIGVDA